MIIDELKMMYDSHFLGDNGIILTINLTGMLARKFHDLLTQIIPLELRDELVYEFVDEGDGIIVKGTKERIGELDIFLCGMEESFRQHEINSVLASESFRSYLKGKEILEGSASLDDFNIFKCSKCGKLEMFDRHGFPMVRPYMCSLCGAYMFSRNSAR